MIEGYEECEYKLILNEYKITENEKKKKIFGNKLSKIMIRNAIKTRYLQLKLYRLKNIVDKYKKSKDSKSGHSRKDP